MRVIYYCIIGLTILQRLHELRLSRHNQQTLSENGFARRDSSLEFRMMVGVHVAWFVALLLEPALAPAQPPRLLAWFGIICFASAQALRQWTIASLGANWNVNVMAPNAAGGQQKSAPAFVSSGPYRFIRHPNYLALVIEFASLPLAGGAYITFAVFSILNGLVLVKRIQTEERQLVERPGYCDYKRSHGALLPRIKLM